MKDNYWRWLGRVTKEILRSIWGWLKVIDWSFLSLVLGLFSTPIVLMLAVVFIKPIILLGLIASFFLISYPIYRWKKED